MKKFQIAVIGMALFLGWTVGRTAQLRAVVKDQRGNALADVVVLATPVDPRIALHAKPPPNAIDQVDKQFVPYVKPIYVGSTVRFPNKDNIRHQVYSFSSPKKFELPLYAGTEAPPVLFEKTGVVILGCNIHDWMIGYIYVADTPFFGKTESAGTATLDDLPAGEYTLRVWHPSMERSEDTTVKRVTLSGGGVVDVVWQLAVKPTLRIPRVLDDATRGYP